MSNRKRNIIGLLYSSIREENVKDNKNLLVIIMK